MPVQRDYILRLLEQAAAAVRRLRELLRGGTGEPTVIIEEARAAQAALFGSSWTLLERVNVTTVTTLVRDARQLAAWADLLRIEADASRALGDEQRATQLAARAAEIAAAAAQLR